MVAMGNFPLLNIAIVNNGLDVLLLNVVNSVQQDMISTVSKHNEECKKHMRLQHVYVYYTIYFMDMT